MQTPKRKPGRYTNMQPDPQVTPAKLAELKRMLEKLKRVEQPHAIAEMQRLAEMGDFSENAAYQIAKGRVRGIDRRIIELEYQISRVELIHPNASIDSVALGHQVTVEIAGKKNRYRILGSVETDPNKGVISRNSPLGAALMGRRVGDVVEVGRGGSHVSCTIIAIE